MNSFGNTRDGRREARESLDRQEMLAKREREEASATRRRLEAGAPQVRAGLAKVNAMAGVDIVAGRSAESVLGGLRAMANLPASHWSKRTAAQHNASYDRLTKAAENLDRLHPSSRGLRRASGYEIGPDSPGRRRNSSFQWSDEFDPPQGVRRVPDARGSVDGDNERGRHFAAGEPEAIVAAWLLQEARRLLENARSRTVGHGYPR